MRWGGVGWGAARRDEVRRDGLQWDDAARTLSRFPPLSASYLSKRACALCRYISWLLAGPAGFEAAGARG